MAHSATAALFGIAAQVSYASALQRSMDSSRNARGQFFSLQPDFSLQPETVEVAEQVCLEHFHSCWDGARRHWAPGDKCQQAFGSCWKLLCTSWLPRACDHGDPACEEVSPMCAITAKRPDSDTSDEDLPLIFMHMPKNAGTAVEQSGIQSDVKWGKFWTWGTVQMPDGYWCNKWHVPPVYLPDPNMYMNAEVFCIVRHPIDRLISEYRYLLEMPWGGKHIRRPEEEDRCHPKGLNMYLKGVMSAVNAGYHFINDCHMVKQSTYIWGFDRQWCQDIIRIENLPEEFDSLMRRAGYKVKLSKENSATTCPNLTKDALEPGLKQMLYDYYKDDFELLNYTAD